MTATVDDMIRYEWREALSASELDAVRALLEAAAEYDREPEFSRIDVTDIVADLESDTPAGQILLIWMLPRRTQFGQPEVPEVLAGVLRLVLDRDAVGDVQVVIAPELRSLGILTLFVECAGLDVTADGGWLGSGARGLRAWAQGNHPAAGRLSNRHFIPRTKRVWKLVRPVDEPWDGMDADASVRVEKTGMPADDLVAFVEGVEGANAGRRRLLHAVGDRQKVVIAARDGDQRVVGAVILDRTPVFTAEYGRCGVIESISRDRTEGDLALAGVLLTAAFGEAKSSGLEGVVLHVDSEDAGLVTASRRARFQHDRTDVRFEL